LFYLHHGFRIFFGSHAHPPSTISSPFLVIFSFPSLFPDQLDLNDLPAINLGFQAVIIAIEPQDPRLPLSVLIPTLSRAAFLVLLIQILDFFDRNKALPAFESESLVDFGTVPRAYNVAL
jgi:hypothetical protein